MAYAFGFILVTIGAILITLVILGLLLIVMLPARPSPVRPANVDRTDDYNPDPPD